MISTTSSETTASETTASPLITAATALDSDPQWYKDAVIYELHVRSFCDSNADGIGDFPGLTEKLEYLKGLGVTALWLLPFYPSPLRDDGYDISDYFGINPAYGTLKDFKRFLRKAHSLGLRVITELVVNHTSNEHAWFQRARRAPAGSRLRDFYVWSDTSKKYEEARIIFKDFETSNWSWDPVAQAYYWHRFYSHQPDLNFDNPAVHEALFKALDFWLGLGVDGMRLDAVPYLYEREGTNCENLSETHEFLRKLRAHIDSNFSGRMLLAEANQWPEDAAAYFGKGDECHMNFHFPLMPRIFMAVQLEDSFPIRDILEQTPPIPETCQWATFLRNHDELTLEMVTDEDRDYMYRVYADDPRARINLGIRRRLAPLLRMRRKVELLNSLLFSLPGTPVLYYGDEIGMGDNIYLGDRNGVRTPMQWSSDRNAGFSRANPQQLYFPVITDPEYHYEATNVEANENNPESLLWWMKRLIDLRKSHRVLGRGDVQVLHLENPKVLAFVRRYENQRLLIVTNLSRSAQYAELDLKEYAGLTPVELFGRQAFPVLDERPLFLSLGPHNFYWFSLEPLNAPEVDAVSQPTILLSGSLETLWSSKAARRELDHALANYVKNRRWFRSKARSIVAVSVKDAIPVSQGESAVWLVLAQVDFRQGDPETYCLPLALASGEEAHEIEQHTPQAIVARTRMAEGAEGVLYDGVYGKGFPSALLELLSRRKELPGRVGVLRSWPERQLRQEPSKSDLAGTVSSAEQSNTSLLFGNEYICKLLRKQDFGPSPELEIGRFLSARGAFPNAPELLGVLEYHTPKQEPATLATLHRYVAHQGDAWELTRNALERFYEQCLTQPQSPKSQSPKSQSPKSQAPKSQAPKSQPPKSQPFRGQDGSHEGPPGSKTGSHGSLLQRARTSLPEPLANLAEAYPAQIRLLGQRTAELHQALSQGTDDPQFAPEPFNTMYQRSLYESTRTRLKRSMAFLRKQRGTLAERERQVAEELLDRQGEFDTVLRALVETKVDAQKIRVHGDYHLGQVLFTGKDFIIIDFEGEPGRTLAERRFKHCPLRDVASMVRSLDYAALSALRTGSLRPSDVEPLEDWARAWSTWMSAAFTNGYLSTLGKTPLLPQKDTNTSLLLDFYLLDKCLYELDYEFNNRPDWVAIPLFGLFGLLAQQPRDRKHQERNGSSQSGSSQNGSSHRRDEETNGDDDAPSSFLGGVS